MKKDGGVEVVDEYSLETSFELTRYLLHAFLKEVQMHGSIMQQELSRNLENQLHCVVLQDINQPTNTTAIEFDPIVRVIREHLDPHFRVMNDGPMVQTHTSNPPWNTGLFASWVQNQLDQPHSIASCLFVDC